jgi:hypothetical protein
LGLQPKRRLFHNWPARARRARFGRRRAGSGKKKLSPRIDATQQVNTRIWVVRQRRKRGRRSKRLRRLIGRVVAASFSAVSFQARV